MIEWVQNLGIVGMGIMVVSFIFWVWALIDILRSDFKASVNKLIWLMVVFFFYALGALVYIFIGRSQKK